MKAIIFFNFLFWYKIKGGIIEQNIEKLENILNINILNTIIANYWLTNLKKGNYLIMNQQ